MAEICLDVAQHDLALPCLGGGGIQPGQGSAEQPRILFTLQGAPIRRGHPGGEWFRRKVRPAGHQVERQGQHRHQRQAEQQRSAVPLSRGMLGPVRRQHAAL